MYYFVIEIQVQHDGSAAHIVTQLESKEKALSKYHSILQYAAVSTLAKHGAVVLDDEGRTVVRESYMHLDTLS